MDEARLRTMLAQVRAGALTEEEALAQLQTLPYEDLGYARLDTHRALRTGMPESVYCPGKTPPQVAEIMARLAERHDYVLATRADPEQAAATLAVLPRAQYHERARIIALRPSDSRPTKTGIVILTAGTSDLPVAEEAALTAEMMGQAVQRIADVGVAGLHRLLDTLPALRAARVLVVVAGMEGALPSVVAGLVRAPVIAVPTSTGYGAGVGGFAALLAMLNSCAPGVAVVNIDNGFGAGRLAAMINDLGVNQSVIAYVEPLSGASGDMLLGALLDVGLSVDALNETLRTLPLPGWRLEQEAVLRGAIGATHVHVSSEEHDAPTRRLADVLRLIDGGNLPGGAAAQARTIFTRLAECEARVHRTTVEAIHFHEVGAADAILDICGVTAGLALLNVDALYCAPLPLNSGGWVETAHGRLPLPAPATLELLARADAPTIPHPARVELLTPTGAAILTVLAQFDRPAMRVHACGYGAGTRLEPVPNILRLTLGENAGVLGGVGESTEELAMLACNIDDMNPQWYGHLYEVLFAGGALDVTCVPALMKKGRPGQILSVLCRETDRSALSDLLLNETTTLGVRRHIVNRQAAERAMITVDTTYGSVQVKLRIAGGRVTQAVPEYEACRQRAVSEGVALAAVTMAAQAAAYPFLGVEFKSEESL